MMRSATSKHAVGRRNETMRKIEGSVELEAKARRRRSF